MPAAVDKYFKAWFDFELKYPHDDVKQWMVRNRSLSVVLAVAYLCLVFVGSRVMASRKAFTLRRWLSVWNVLMFALSLAIFVRIANFTFEQLFRSPFYNQVCFNHFEDEPLVFWLDLFVITKPIEFIDTLFIVLRKQPLHFLHYYHHSTVVILCWFSLGINPGPPNGLYFAMMNSFIHTIMYLYYLLRSMRITLPRPLQMSITGLQITQMGIGCFVNLLSLAYRCMGYPCVAAYESIFLALAIYSCYFILFADYFRKAYFANRSRLTESPVKMSDKIE